MTDITLGLIGLACLVLAWVPQTLDIFRTKTSAMNPNFSLLYIAGSWLLTYYSWTIGDLLFTCLNAVAGIFALITFYYSHATFRRKAGARKGRRR